MAEVKTVLRPEKRALVEEIARSLKSANVAILTDYRGLTAQEMTELRRNLREAGVNFKIFKNTLATIAAKEADVGELEEFLKGPTAIAFGFDDPARTAKLLSDFSKEHVALDIKGALFEDRVLGKDKVKELAALPSKDVLIAQLLGTLNAPMSRLVNVLSGPVRNLTSVLSQIAETKKDKTTTLEPIVKEVVR